MENTSSEDYIYNRIELEKLQEGFHHGKNNKWVKNPNVKTTPVRVFNPLTGRKILLTSLYNYKEYRDGKMIYQVERNILKIDDEELREKAVDILLEKIDWTWMFGCWDVWKESRTKLNYIDDLLRIKLMDIVSYKVGQQLEDDSDSDSDYDSDYEDYWDGFTWDSEGNIYLSIDGF